MKRTSEGRWTGVLRDSAKTKQCGKMIDHEIIQNLKNNPTGSGTDTVILINTIQQGTGYNQRIGNIVRLKSLSIKLAYTQAGVNQPSIDLTRVAIVYDRQPTGNYVTYEDIFQQQYTSGTGSTSTCHPNYNFIHRFVIIRDYLKQLPGVTHPVGPNNTATLGAVELGGKKSNILQEYIDLSGLESVFSGTANPMTEGQFTTGCLYVVLQGLHAFPANAWYAYINLRLRYDDQ